MATPPLRHPLRWAAGLTLAFLALDLALLSALPRLGLSFGPIALPLLALLFGRVALLLALLFVHGVSLVRGKQPAQGVTSAILLLLFNLAASACLVDAFYLEPFDLRITYLEPTLPGLELDAPLRIVQLSDLHVERTTVRERELLPLVESLQPDLIVLTGDYLNLSNVGDPVARRDARALLAQLHAPLGVYAVSGTVDPPEAMHALFDGLDITVLNDEVACLPPERGNLCLVGVANLQHERDQAALAATMAQVPAGARTLLLYHKPDLIESASAAGVDLYLAGHTHGGQIRLPLYGAVVTFSIYGKQYEQGLYSVGPTTLYVSRGLGMEGSFAPRARFLCPPEVVVVDLAPAGQE